MAELTSERRLQNIRKATSLFLLLGVTLSYPLWLSAGRSFPVLPVIESLPIIGSPFDFLLLGGLVLGVVWVFFSKRPAAIWALLGLLLLLLIQDYMRWQPWVYVYILLLLPFVLKNKSGYLNYVIILLAGIYVWSGIHKLNPNFVELTFSDILTTLFQIKSPETLRQLQPLGYLIPVLEIAMGICLLFPRLRNIGVYLVLLSHSFILLYLSPFGTNYNIVVYPWNVAMMVVVWLACYKNDIQIITVPKGWSIAGVMLVWVMPALNLAGAWDHYPSFSLYADKIHEFYIAVEEKEVGKLPVSSRRYFVQIAGMQGGEVIDINAWSMGELNVPFYPETRVFKQLTKPFCTLKIPEDKLVFIEFEKPMSKGVFTSWGCINE
ncbi:MAG: MauE/DoxX family redox-associated membrane protein [Bacteroidia bacterium]